MEELQLRLYEAAVKERETFRASWHAEAERFEASSAVQDFLIKQAVNAW